MLSGYRAFSGLTSNTAPYMSNVIFIGGNWDLHNQIPSDSISYDTFEKLRENLNQVLRNLLEETSEDQFAEKSAVLKAKHLYESCTNSGTLLSVMNLYEA